MSDEPQGNLQQSMAAIWANRTGWGALTTVNHTTVGLRFMLTGLFFFLVGGLLAMLLRTQLALPEQQIIAPELYNQLFTMHGTVMMFLFAIPVLEGVAIYLTPKMIGTRDLVYPRMTALGYYCYLFGGLIILSSLLLGVAPDAGWFMYTPLSSAEFSPGPGSDFWLLGITFVEISAMAAGIELTVSILRTRAPGMALLQMPIFAWYILAMALMIVFGFPPLILASILLELERAAGMPFFAVAGGGDPLLWQHLFWLFGHPEVYIIFLPAAGIVSTLLPVFAQRPLVGYRWIVLSIITTGFISFGLWVHHMFTVGIPQLALAFFSVSSMLVAVPTAVQMFAWLATLWTGRVVYRLPMLWLLGFLVVFVCGGLTGVMLALVPFNWQVHDTHFVVAHMHYVLVGGMFFPLVAGLYYWLPHLSGRMASESLGRWGFWLTFIGFNATFLLMHLTGLLGMPRRIYTYEAGLGWDWLNLLSSIGSFVMAAGIAAIILDVTLHFFVGRRAPKNPWQADTLEWATATPPDNFNFLSLPPVTSRHPLWEQPQLPERIARGEFGLTDTHHGKREIYGTDAITGKLREIILVPSNSWRPLQASLALALVCVSLLLRLYPLALAGSALAAFFMLRWSWENGAHPKAAPPDNHEPQDLRWHSRTFDGPGLWGMVVTLMANGTFYISLLFGWFYLWIVAEHWSLPEQSPLAFWPLFACGVLLSLAVLRYGRLIRHLRRRDDRHLAAGLWQTAALGLAHWLLLVWVLVTAPLAATETSHDALLLVMLFYLLFHSGLGTLITALQALRVRLGYVNAAHPYEPMVAWPFWLYTLGIFWLSLAAFVLLPLGWGPLS
ncbi:cytochrome c oxidase subunit I [Marinobacter sp. GN3S48]|uniref:cytochrome c oxidase subunit I n=1 Tax=Marinobacter sp. GN3S48 TaxID=3382302 RepID=UPI00387AF7C7